MKESLAIVTPIASGMVLPNHSGNKRDPVNDYDIATKKYVDDNAGGAPEGTAVKSTGEAGGVKFLREDGDGTCSWQLPAGGGNVSKVGTPVNNQVGVWTGDGTIEGDTALLFDTTTDTLSTGNIAVTGLVDGRDVATDGTKLDGIEAGATADQTGAEIKIAYEGEADTNAFTDAEKTKLTGIEASADVTDTANVTSAGALMDSEVDADLKTFALPANTTISAFGATLVDDADASTARSTLGLGAVATLASIDISSNTNLAAGTNITLSGDTLNVDDSFLVNNANDTTSGVITMAGGVISGDASSADTAYVPMVLYNTDATPPAASGFPIGTLYVQYTA